MIEKVEEENEIEMKRMEEKKDEPQENVVDVITDQVVPPSDIHTDVLVSNPEEKSVEVQAVPSEVHTEVLVSNSEDKTVEVQTAASTTVTITSSEV